MGLIRGAFVGLNIIMILACAVISAAAITLLANKKLARRLFDVVIINDDEWLDLTVEVGRRVAVLVLPLTIVVGLIAVCGFAGAVWNNSALMQMYIFGLLLMVLASLVIVLVIGLRKKSTEEAIFDFIHKQLMEKYNGDHTGQSSSATLLIDTIQIHFECCGLTGYKDYSEASGWPEPRSYESYEGLSYPASCCMWNSREHHERYILPFHLWNEDKCMAHSISLAEGQETEGGASAMASNADVPCRGKLLAFFEAKIGIVYVFMGSTILVEFLMSMVGCVFARKTHSRRHG